MHDPLALVFVRDGSSSSGKFRFFSPLLLLAALGCSSGGEARPHDEMERRWLEVGEVKLAQSGDKAIGAGECKTGTVAGLHVDLCIFKDALSADNARTLGLERIGPETGAALVRERQLLVIADHGHVDPHGKKLNEVAKLFMKSD